MQYVLVDPLSTSGPTAKQFGWGFSPLSTGCVQSEEEEEEKEDGEREEGGGGERRG